MKDNLIDCLAADLTRSRPVMRRVPHYVVEPSFSAKEMVPCFDMDHFCFAKFYGKLMTVIII